MQNVVYGKSMQYLAQYLCNILPSQTNIAEIDGVVTY